MIDAKTMVKLFDMHNIVPYKLTKDSKEFNGEEGIKFLFPNNPSIVATRKILTTRLFIEYRIVHYARVKCILPWTSNIANIIEDELFLM